MLCHKKAQERPTFAECLTFMSNGVARAVYCPHCATPNVKKNGVKANRISVARNAIGIRTVRSVQFAYKYPGADQRLKRKVCEMAMNGTGLAHQWHPRYIQGVEN